jgi:4'-phosphopantetheinyl transferase
MRHPGRPDPGDRQVHLRIVRLEASEDNFERCLAWLSPEETARADRFRFPRHRRAFVLGRAALRALVASYLGMDAADVNFIYGPQGKPALENSNACSLRFNASNSGNLAAYAFTGGCDIGVDVEQHRALADFENIARRFFSPEETDELMALADGEKTAAFFRCWTRKEAYIKALGGGLSIPLDSFRVTLRPGDAARLVSSAGGADGARGWTMHEFDPGPGYAGAIAYPDAPRSVQTGPIITVDELLDELLPYGARKSSSPRVPPDPTA